MLLSIGPLWKKLQWNIDQYAQLFVQEKAYENIVSEMAAILSGGWWGWGGMGVEVGVGGWECVCVCVCGGGNNRLIM